MADRTGVVIAHRLSTVKSANVVAVLSDGVVQERWRPPDFLRFTLSGGVWFCPALPHPIRPSCAQGDSLGVVGAGRSLSHADPEAADICCGWSDAQCGRYRRVYVVSAAWLGEAGSPRRRRGHGGRGNDRRSWRPATAVGDGGKFSSGSGRDGRSAPWRRRRSTSLPKFDLIAARMRKQFTLNHCRHANIVLRLIWRDGPR